MIGLGRMGNNMVQRLLRAGHWCVVYDLDPKTVRALVNEGAVRAKSLKDHSEADFAGKVLPAMHYAFASHIEKPSAPKGGYR